MKKIDLNGFWQVDYLSGESYCDQGEPTLTESAVAFPVPGYWEDHTDIFRSTALHARLKWNPLYTLQRYPQAGYVPDMALPDPVGSFVYQREVELEQAAPCVLWFGGVQNAVSAWINGQYLGRHEGYSAAFSLPVPEGVLQKGTNRITLAVSNLRLQGYEGRPISGLTSRAANECTGGIYGDVELRYSGAIGEVWVTTHRDLTAFTVHIEHTAPVTVTVWEGEMLLRQAALEADEPTVDFSTEGLSFWSPEEPNLYRVEVRAGDEINSHRFGIRRLTAEGTTLYLNGEPYYFRGTCEHCYHPITVHPTRDINYYRRVLRVLKGLGFNSIRFHTYIPMVEYIEAADELGMVLELESPNNTTLAEWHEILRMARRYTSPVLYSTGNEMTIDAPYIAHLQRVADLVHTQTDSLFSPMSAMRGVEYSLRGFPTVEEPFKYNPAGLAALSEFCDVYNSYSLGLTSYRSDQGDPVLMDRRNAVYKKPLLSHEICITGTYIDLSLKERYRGSRIGDTELFTSVERHLEQKGLLSRAPLYYRNSAHWQALLRKDCFETVRRANTFAGYDFLGDIDTHWHTFGYCVGMMNEFYELKPGETAENVRRYNSDTVLLADLPRCRNLLGGTRQEISLSVSHFGKAEEGELEVCLLAGDRVIARDCRHLQLKPGGVSPLGTFTCSLPEVQKPTRLVLRATLSGALYAENRWELYLFPQVEQKTYPVTAAEQLTATELEQALRRGERVVLLGAGPFESRETSFQLSVAGRTNGHLATAVAEHPLVADLPHEGYCGWAFREMLNGGRSVALEGVPYEPIIEIATSYKNARPEGLIFEYRVGEGRLLVCSLDLKESDPGACWLKDALLHYAAGEEFQPKHTITPAALRTLYGEDATAEVNANEAGNLNDITLN